MKRLLTSLLAIGILASAPLAYAVGTSEMEDGATPWRLGANTHLLFSNTTDDSETSTLLNESDVRAEYGHYNIGIHFSDRMAPDSAHRAVPDRPFVLEKAFGAYEGDNWQLKFGDSYQELGRGIALSLYRDPVFGLDTTLQGAAIGYNGHGVNVTAIGGRVNTLQVPVAINPQPSPLPLSNVYLAGGSAKFAVTPDSHLEGHYLVAEDQRFNQTRFDQGWNVGGASVQIDGIADSVDLYVEANVIRSNSYDVAEPTGYGNYVSATYSAGPWKLKAEGKDYRQPNSNWTLNRPPTMEDDVVPTLNTNDVSAGRLYAERRLGENPNNLVHASFLYGWDGAYLTQVHHGIVGGKFEGPFGAIYEWKGGYRWLPGNQWIAHAGLKGKVKTFKGQSLELGWRKWYYRYGMNIAAVDDDHNAIDFSYVFSERYSLNLGYEFVPTVFQDENPNYFNAGGTVKLGALTARLFAGRTSGGFICSGGICRQVQPYTGVYVDTTYTF